MSRNQESLSQDTVFDLLSSPRRRFILYYLRSHGGEASLDELTTQIAAWENGLDPDELTSQDEKRVYVSLYQTHIPKFEETGIVEYDSDEGIVRLTEQAREFDRYLSRSEPSEFPWQLYYVGLAVVGGLLFALSALQVSIFAALSPVVIGAAVILVFGASAVVQYVYEQRIREEIPTELQMED